MSVYQGLVSRAGTSYYISPYLWNVITCPCPWYLHSLWDRLWITTALWVYLYTYEISWWYISNRPQQSAFVRGTVGLRLDSSHRGEKWMFSLLLACISSLTNFQWSETPWWSCYVTLTIEGLPDEPTCRDYKGSYCWSQRETLCPYPWSRYGLSEVLTTYEWTPTQSGTR